MTESAARWDSSSVGRASALQAECRRFDPCLFHLVICCGVGKPLNEHLNNVRKGTEVIQQIAIRQSCEDIQK